MEVGTGCVFIVLIAVTSVVALPTPMTSLTLFTEKKNWNEARFICESLGGHLLYIKNAQKEAVVEAYMSAEPWKSALGLIDKSFHIGLYNLDEDDPGLYTWLDCEGPGSWTDWLTAQPYKPTEKLCAIQYTWFTSKGWGSEDCDDTKKFVCEVVGGTCNYNQLNDTRGVDSAPYDAGLLSVTQCLELCDTVLSNGEECWAVTWSATKCELHFSALSDYFDDPENTANSPNEYLFKKECIAALTSEESFPLMTMDFWKPFPTCPGSQGSGTGIVYTLFYTNVTWDEAVWICEEIGQSLLVLESPQDGIMIQTLYGGYSEAYWLGMNGSAVSGFYWIDGTALNWDDFAVTPTGTESSCVADTPSSNTWTTHACDEQRPFICQKTGGSCRYTKVENTRGTEGSSQGKISRSVCEANCQQSTDCVGYSHYYRFLTYDCEHHFSNDQGYLFNPANLLTGESSWDVYRLVCTTGLVFNEAPVILEVIEGMNVTDLSAETSSSDPLQKSSSIPEESSSIQELSSAQMTTVIEMLHTASTDYLIDKSSTDIAMFEISSASDMDATSAVNLVEMTTRVSEILYTLPSGYLTEMPSTTSGFVTEQTTHIEPYSSVTDTGQSVISSTYENIAVASESPELSTETNSLYPTFTSSSSTGQSLGDITTNSDQMSSSSQTTPYFSTTSTTVATPTLKPPESTVLTFCPCKCHVPISLNETTKLVESIRKKLLLERTLLKKELRRRTSAEDERVSSRGIGYVAITFFSLVLAVTFLADVSLLFTHFKMFFGNIFVKG